MAVSFIISLVFAVLGRAVPQMNVFTESFAVRPLVGLSVFGLTLELMSEHIINYLRQSARGHAAGGASCDALTPERHPMSEQAGEKTEKPTAKRLEEALKKGQIARSPEVQTVFVLMAARCWR